MKTLQKISVNIVLIFFSISIYAQTNTIKGKITDSNGNPIEFANVILKKLQKGVTTDSNGNYSITVNEGSYTIVASFISFETVEKKITVKTNETVKVNFILKESSSQLDEVVVSASRTPEKLSEIPASITIVDAKQLEDIIPITTNINDILEFTVPGLAPSTGTYSSWGQTLRGRQLLVMVDGIPQSTPLRNAKVDLKSIQPNDILRVEVIKGATAIYGNGGDGGIINYITKKANKHTAISGNSNVWTTSNLSKTEDALGWGLQQSLTGTLDKFSYYISGSYEETGNKYDANGDVLLPTYGLDNSKIYSILGKVGYKINEDQSISAMFNHYNSRQNSPFVATRGKLEVFNADGDYKITPGKGVEPSSTNPKLGDPTGITTTNGQLKYKWNNIFLETTNLEADVYYQKSKNIFFYSPSFKGGGQSVVNSEKFGFRPVLHSELDLNSPIKLSFTYGLDVLKDKTNQGLLDGRLWVPNLDLFSVAPFLQTTLRYKENWVFKAGVRYDNMKLTVDDYKTLAYDPKGQGNYNLPVDVSGGNLDFSSTSVNIGVRYIENEKFIPYASYSQGFSLPDLGRTLRGATAKKVSDIDLEAIKTNNYEFGFLSKFKHVRFEAVAYYSTSNLGLGLAFNDANNRFEQSKNPMKIFGAEVALDFTFLNNALQFGTSYSYVEGLTHKADNPHNLVYAKGDVISPPKTTAYITVKPIKKLTSSLRLVYVGDRERFNPIEKNGKFTYGYPQAPVEAYTIINFSSTYNATKNLDISLGINNLFNNFYLPARAQWAAPLGSQTTAGEGISAKLSVSYTF